MKGYFITATGTDVGKTLITAALAHQLLAQGRRVQALKPVISGFDPARIAESDTGQLLAAQGLPLSQDAIAALSPWCFAAPISPDMAAEEEGRDIDFDRLVAFCREPRDADYLLIEGVGGVMVPLTKSHTVLDWMKALGFPVILVTGSYLGALSHTLTSASVILSAGLKLHAVAVSESENPPVPLERVMVTLRRFLPEETPVTSITRLDSCAELWKYVSDITHSLDV